MGNLNQATTFMGLLEQCKQIKVPRIQRDYAQGRSTAKEVRDGFLDALHAALAKPADSQATPLNLDFIYGSREGITEDQYFLPLDGQQRLTTLFLLHWYMAWRDGKLQDFKARLWDGKHSRFTYQVRPSSAEFLDALVGYVPESLPSPSSSVRSLLEDQPWFFLNWRLDPTIQSALTMLDAIHLRFHATEGLYVRLVDEQRPAITFQLLELKDFGLSDDLYIKMNSRGKPLTPFETFKARFEDHLKTLFPTERRLIDGKEWTTQEFFALRMDTQWTDLFWSYRTKTNPVFDSELMNLLWAVAQVSLNPARADFLKRTAVLQYRWGAVTYTALHEHGLLTREFSEQLIALLEAWSSGGGKLTRQLEPNQYFDEEVFFQKIIKAPGSLNYGELLQFAGFVAYLDRWRSAVDSAELRTWMRLVSNLAVNTSYDHVDVFQRCMSALQKLLPDSKNILSHLAGQSDVSSLGGFSPQQLQEEALKAKLLLAHPGWSSRIERAEGHGYFQGQIEFLLEFSGLRTRALESLVEEWPDVVHLELQACFDSYFAKASITFDRAGLLVPSGAQASSYLWQRALLSVGDYLMPVSSNRSFGINAATEPDSWKRYLRAGRDDASRRRKCLHSLWDRMDASAPVAPQLQQVIDAATGLEPWRAAIVDYPEVMNFCERQNIRKVSDDQVYLLKRSQMNGAHVELFSYALYQDLRIKATKGELAPLALPLYQSVSGSSVEPSVALTFGPPNARVNFFIESVDGKFRIGVERSQLTLASQVEEMLKGEMGFADDYEDVVLYGSRESALEVVEQLVRKLANLPRTAA